MSTIENLKFLLTINKKYQQLFNNIFFILNQVNFFKKEKPPRGAKRGGRFPINKGEIFNCLCKYDMIFL